MKLPRTYAERHGEAIFACEMTAGRLPAHGDDARPRVAKGSHWYPPDNAPRTPADARAARATPWQPEHRRCWTSRGPSSGAASVAASRRSEPRHQSRTPHRPQPVAIALSRSAPCNRTRDLAGMLTVAVPMGA